MEKQTNSTTHTPYLISILITQNGYSFYVLDTTNKAIESFKAEELEQADANTILNALVIELKQHWQEQFSNAQIQICYHHAYFSVVPTEIYEADMASEYLKYNTQLFANDSISCDTNISFEVTIPFIPYVNIHNELLNTYETVDFTHSINLGLDWASKLCKGQKGEYALAVVQKEAFILILIKDQKLQLANYFDYKTAEDFTYYSLFALEQNRFDREEMHFSMVGNVSSEDEIFNYLHAYIRSLKLISVEDLNPTIHLDPQQDEFFHTHPFLALSLCE